MWATSVPILVFLGLSVFDLGQMYANAYYIYVHIAILYPYSESDVRQTDVRRASSLNAPYLGVRA